MRLRGRGGQVRRRAARGWVVETLEGRALLTAATPATVVQTSIPISNVPTDTPLTAANAAAFFPLASRDAADSASTSPAARAALAPQAQASSSPAGTVGDTGKLAVTTAWNGYWLVHSVDVANVGLKYVKTAVSHDVRKLAASYLKAIFTGNTKALGALGHSQTSRDIGSEFAQLGKTQPVTQLGQKFTTLGRSASAQWDGIFG